MPNVHRYVCKVFPYCQMDYTIMKLNAMTVSVAPVTSLTSVRLTTPHTMVRYPYVYTHDDFYCVTSRISNDYNFSLVIEHIPINSCQGA